MARCRWGNAKCKGGRSRGLGKPPRSGHDFGVRSRTPLLVFGLLAVGLTGLVGVTRHMIQKDRDELFARFSADRLEEVEQSAAAIEEDFADVADDLRFAGRMVADATNTAERRRDLAALLGTVRAYRAVGIYDDQGAAQLMVTEPRQRTNKLPSGYRQRMDEAAVHLLAQDQSTRIEISEPLDGDVEGWFRVFTALIPAAERPGAGRVIALLVDTRPLLERLRLVVAEPGEEFLVLGPFGNPVPQSSERLTQAIEALPQQLPTSPLGRLVHSMQNGEQGTIRIDEAEAEELGLGAGEVVAAFAPIRLEGGPYWSVATLSSMSILRTHEDAIMRRFGLVAAAFALTLVGFGLFVVVSSLKASALRERLEHAAELARLREKAEKILEHIPSGVMVLSDEQRLSGVNRALEDRAPGTLLGEPLDKALPAASAEAIAKLSALVAEARLTRQPTTLLGERLQLFGPEGYYSVHAVPLQPHSADAHTLLVLDDLSEVRALEGQLLKAEKLATVGVLAAGIAHEVGTPLGVIRGRAEQTLARLGEDHPQAPACRIIIEQIDRIARTIRALLDFSRVQPINLSAVSVDGMVKKIGELLRYELERRRLSLEAEIPEGLPSISANTDQLQQVLLNLVLNALDASTPGEPIRIVAHANTESREGAECVRLEVIDQGIGIPEENLHQVFDPFFTTKKRGQGTGLGLTIVGQIVRSHGAHIELSSDKKRGTRVALWWPVARTPELRHAG